MPTLLGLVFETEIMMVMAMAMMVIEEPALTELAVVLLKVTVVEQLQVMEAVPVVLMVQQQVMEKVV